MPNYDIIVIGAGAHGSAAAYRAARRGQRVALLEQFAIDHQRGSSYGLSRIIRYSYDDAAYVRLAKAVYPMWMALEAEAGESLLIQRVGGVDIGRPNTSDMTRRTEALDAEGIPYEILSHKAMARRFPQFRLDEDQIAIYQAETGILRASACVRAHVRLARAHGAEVREQAKVASIQPTGDGVDVQLASGETLSAARVILAANGWLNDLLRPLDLQLPLQTVHCQENYFAAEPAADFEVGRFPAFIAYVQDEWGLPFYGIPGVDGSRVKVALHGGPPITHPDAASQGADAAVSDRVRAFSRRYLPAADAPLVYSRQCLYTLTPDEHFILDAHPAHPQIVLASACSGHGFKFSTLIGSILVDLALDGATPHGIERFRLGRFGAS